MCKLLMTHKTRGHQGWEDRIWVELLFNMNGASACGEGKTLQMDHGKGCAALPTH